MLEVPPLLVPAVHLPEPSYQVLYGDQSGIIMNSSFLVSEERTHTNSAGLTAAIGLGKGLWELFIYLYHVASYTDLVNAGGVRIALVDTGAFQDFEIIRAKPVTNVPTVHSRVLRISLPRDSANVDWIVDTNAAGETDFFFFSLLANRLA